MHRHEDLERIAERDDQDPIRFTPVIEELRGDVGWETKEFVKDVPAYWSAVLGPRWERRLLSDSGGRWRFTIQSVLIAVAVVAVGVAAGLWLLGRTPRAQERRRLAMRHARSAHEWADYAQLSEKGITSIVSNALGQHLLVFNHFVQPQRPPEQKAAQDFDRECERTASICRARAAYHAQMSQKWLRGYRYPCESVPPDPPPPFPIEASSIRDSIY